MILPQDIIREARALIGTPWLHQGRTALGVDCIGLLWLAATNAGVDMNLLGVSLPRRYGRVAERRLYEETNRLCKPCEPKPGCLLLFKFPGDKYPRHFGILTDVETIIHADAKARMQVIEHGFRGKWIDRQSGSWEFPGVTYE